MIFPNLLVSNLKFTEIFLIYIKFVFRLENFWWIFDNIVEKEVPEQNYELENSKCLYLSSNKEILNSSKYIEQVIKMIDEVDNKQ